MSQIKTKKFGFLFMIAMFAFILFGCGKDPVPVSSVSFKFDDEQVVMYVGQTLELNERIEFTPADATDKTYTLTSLDESVLSVNGSQVSALQAGSTYVKVVSNENNTLQDVVKISVETAQTNLTSPKNLTYDHMTQTFSFNPVDKASSYTIKINEVEYEIGNTTTFNLNSEKFDQNIYNNILQVQVRANPSKYDYAHKSSLYAGVGERPLQIYQAAPVSDLKIKGGTLSFQKNGVSQTTISLQTKGLHDLSTGEKSLLLSGENLAGGETISSKYAQSSLSINGLNSNYMGKRLYAYVLSEIDDEKREELGSKVNCYNSIASIAFDVLPNIDITINDYIVSWTKLEKVSSYKIFINGIEKATVSTNKFDLASLEDIDNYQASETAYTLEVKPEITEVAAGVVQADARFEVKFNRLESVEVSATANGIEWTQVDLANTYYVYTSITGKTVPLKTNNFSLLAYPAGTYTLEVSAANLGGLIEGVYYIPSQAEDIIIEKKPQASIEITNYSLKIKDTQVAEDYLVEFDIDGVTEYSKVETAASGEILVALSAFNFTPGLHEINVTRLGNTDNNTINSKVSKVWFTQLEAINAISVNEGKTIITRSDINARANFYLQIQSSALAEEKNIQLSALTYAYQTVNTEHENYLPAGDYSVKLFVKGDGSETFSYRENGVEVPTAQTTFTVLEAPSVTLNNHSVTKIEYTEIDGAEKYYIYSGTEKVATKASTSYDFELDEGTTKFTVQAVGNGVTTLTSCLSNEITIHRLETPTLIFDNENDINSFAKHDDDDIKTEAIGGHSLLLNDVATGYSFDGSTFTDFEETNVFKLITIAKEQVIDGVYYINSKPYVLTIGKIANNATINLTKENVLTIKESSHTEQYNLQVVFTVNGSSKTFVGANGILTNGSVDIPYTYNSATKTYSISMVDSNHNEVLDGSVEHGFDVKVRFIKPSLPEDIVRNSDYVSSLNIELNKIDETSILTINNSNKLIIEPTNQDKAYYLRLNLIQGATNITLSEVDGKLVGDGYELNFVKSGNVYAINLLDSDYNFLIDAIDANFTVRVAYSHNDNAGSTDTDSGYTTAKTVTFEEKSMLSRSAQTVVFENVNDAYTADSYWLQINGTKCRLYDVLPAGGQYILNIEDLYLRYPTVFVDGINEIKVITKNIASTEADMRLSVIGEAFYCEREQVLSLQVNKDNNAANNSLVVQASTYATSYDKTYIFEILNQDKTKTIYYEGETQTRKDSNAVAGKLTLNVDDYVVNNTKFGDKVYISARVETAGSYVSGTKTVYVYNSFDSTPLEYDIISTVTGIKIEDSKLYFNEVAGAAGYEIYEKNGATYSSVRLNSNLILTSPYDLTEIEGHKEIVVKAVAQNGLSNSSYSSSVDVIKLVSPTIGEQGGDFLIEYGSDVVDAHRAGGTVNLVINNSMLTVNLKSLPSYATKVDDTSILISADKLLQYNSQLIEKEDFTFKLVVAAPTGKTTYYLNSNPVESAAYGVHGPSNIRKVTMEEDDMSFVENMVWNANSNNILNNVDVEVKYEMMVTYTKDRNNYTFTSNDVGLKYIGTNGAYQSYGTIYDPEIFFPVGYDINGDGLFTADGEVKFEQGNYSVKVRAVPQLGLGSYNLYASSWSPIYEFKILKTPELFTDNGNLVWDIEADAEKYVVTLYQNGQPILSNPEVIKQEEAIYKFDNKQLTASGMIDVTIKAISTKSNVLNSVVSEAYSVYRMPEASALILDDGSFILSAVEYFKTAKIEFYNSTVGTQYHYIDNTERADEFLAEITDLGLANVDATKLTRQVGYLINGETLNITAGYSYSVNVTLMGLSSEDFGVVNSARVEKISEIQPTKIIPVDFSVNKGILQFDAKATYDSANINYDYYNGQNTIETFWKDTAIYKVTIMHNKTLHEIYAVDYYKFMQVKDTAACPDYIDLTATENEDLSYVVKMGDIKFNVFHENQINLSDNAYIHYYQTYLDGVTVSNVIDGEIELDNGGSLFIDVFMLGGDSYIEDNGASSKQVGYVTANSCDLNPFVRYAINTLGADEALVEITNLVKYSIIDDTKIIDYPVYRFEVSPVGEEDVVQVVYVYTVDVDPNTMTEISGLNHAKDVALKNDRTLYEANKIMYVEAGGDVRLDSYLTFDISPYFEAGNYNIKVKTLAGYGVDGLTGEYYWLNARDNSNTELYKKLSPTTFAINADGHLSLSLSHVVSDWLTDYSYTYEITICEADGSNEFVYEINDSSEGVERVGDTMFVYVMPTTITYKGANYTLEENVAYKIKVRAKSDMDYVADGTYQQVSIGDGFIIDTSKDDATFEFTKTQGVESVEIINGQLRWVVKNRLTYNQLAVKLIKTDGTVITTKLDGYVVYAKDGSYLYHYSDLDGKYRIGNEYDVGRLETYIESGEYDISVYVVGDQSNNLVDSNVTKLENVNRLSKVDIASIASHNGVLEWEEVENAVKYELTITNTSTYQEYKYETNTNSLAIEDAAKQTGTTLPVGSYSIAIKAVGDDSLSSLVLASDVVAGYEKLSPVEDLALSANGDFVTWTKHDLAQGYKVRVSYVHSLNGQVEEEQLITDPETTQIEVPKNVVGRFTVEVNAIGLGDSKIFNSDWATLTTSADTPMPVGEVGFDYDTYTFNWSVGDDLVDDDKMLVEYTFEKYTSTGVAAAVVVTSEISYDGSTSYSFKLKEIGKYTQFSVRVVRANAGSSAKMIYTNNLDNGIVDFNIYAYGSYGVYNNDYFVITNANHLMNIKYNPSARFKLGANINVTDVYTETNLKSGTALICDTFSGTLDGTEEKFAIVFGVNETYKYFDFQNVTSIALFNKLSYANINNVVIGDTNVEVTIRITYDNVISDGLSLALLANKNTASTINNVEIKNMKLIIDSIDEGKLSGDVYIAGMFAESKQGSINETNVDFAFELNIDLSEGSTYMYVAGVVAVNGESSTATNMTFINVEFGFATSISKTVYAIGGVVANITSTQTVGVSNVTVSANIVLKKAKYAGLIAGYVDNAVLSVCKASGRLEYLNVEINEAYIGGLAGYAYDTSIEDSDIRGLTFNITTSNISGKDIGAIVGRIYGSSQIVRCRADVPYSGKTSFIGGVLTMGVYGYKQSSIYVESIS